MYTTRVSRGRGSCGRGTRSRISGICSPRSESRRRIRTTDPVEMPVDDAGRERAAPSARARGRARPTTGSSSCTSAPATRSGDGRSSRSPRWPPSWPAATRAPHRRHVGPSEREAGARVIAAARRRSSVHDRDRVSTAASSRCPSFARWSTARRSTSAATAGRCTSRRRATCRSSLCMARRCRRDRRRGASSRLAGRGGRSRRAACRPCDQRSCVPGDFRCLTWIQPEQVIEAAERALARTGKMTIGTRLNGWMPHAALVGAHAPRRIDRRPARAVRACWRSSASPPRFSSRSRSRSRCSRRHALLARAWSSGARERFEVPRFFWPLLAYAALTLVSAAFSPQPARQPRRLEAAACCS